MEHDFPAAHSMDTYWYVIDAEGSIACFDTGEDGHALVGSGEANIIGEYWVRTCPLSGYHDPEEMAEELGFYFYLYDWNFDPINTYWRSISPASPLHVDQLPPDLRDSCRAFQLATVKFRDTEIIQPFEFGRCSYWYEDGRVAYVASDGVTIRPIPGMEARFTEFCRNLRAENPKEFARYRFEPPT